MGKRYASTSSRLCSFVFGLFSDAFGSSDDTVSNNRINRELEGMWNEVVLAKFGVSSRTFVGGIDGNH